LHLIACEIFDEILLFAQPSPRIRMKWESDDDLNRARDDLVSGKAEKSNGDDESLPWCTVVSGRIDLNIGGVRVEAIPLIDQGWQMDDAKRPRWES